ncbi:MAG: ABC transporter ATP-binding protein [Ignavibacteria bacterium]|nr:ABC transporter ATP-binding protein [Ignavibacteria bacterium]
MFLNLQNISKKFSNNSVLENINLEIQKGEFFSLLGPSGCGKTTLLRIISGLEHSDSGNIILEGKDVTKLTPQQRKVGIVFQNYALFPNMNVAKNVAYGLEIKKESKDVIDRKVKDVLKKVNLSHKENASVSELSGGEQQRASLARVIVNEPSLILFDEPLSNLDYALRLEAREELKRLQREAGITSVYVTHDQGEALALSDRIAVMNKGVIQQIGSPKDLYNNPVNSFVAGFVGHYNIFSSEESDGIMGITDIGKDEALIILPENLKIRKSEKPTNIQLKEILYNGSFTEFILKTQSKEIKSICFSNEKIAEFAIDDFALLEFNPGKIKVIKK